MNGIQSTRLRDQIVDRLREEIVLGKFSEGEPLRETPLAKRFDVSRGPIRDAILQLGQRRAGGRSTQPRMHVSGVSGTRALDRPW